MFFEILTLFPSMFDGVFSDSIIRRAIDKSAVSIRIDNIRSYSGDTKHKTVDDYPYGGEPGMLLKTGPVTDAIKASRLRLAGRNPRVVYLTPQGRRLDHGLVMELLREEALVLLCGRYKGIDQRVIDKYVDLEISIGDYVLSGGEIPAMVLVDALTRLIPGVLGDRASAENDSFFNGLLAPPHYTRPEIFEDMQVPPVLLSGHHEHIRKWQKEMAEKRTRDLRPDLWERYQEEKDQDSHDRDGRTGG